MARIKRFTFLCDGNERRILAALAKQLQRSQSDSVRWLIREAARELQADTSTAPPAEPKPVEVAHEPQAA